MASYPYGQCHVCGSEVTAISPITERLFSRCDEHRKGKMPRVPKRVTAVQRKLPKLFNQQLAETDGGLYEEVKRYINVSMKGYAIANRMLWEDAMQEAFIQAWRDTQDGVEPKLKVMRRAKLAAERFYQKNGEYFFGRTATSRDGLRRNSDTIDKVSRYVMTEFMPLFKRYPTSREVSDATGIPMKSVSLALKHVRNGNVDHTIYKTSEEGTRRRDYKAYSVDSIEGIIANQKEIYDNDDNEVFGYPQFQIPSFEDDVDARIDIEALLSKLTEVNAEVLRHHLLDGMTPAEIGREYLGVKRHFSQMGIKAINRALVEARRVINEDS